MCNDVVLMRRLRSVLKALDCGRSMRRPYSDRSRLAFVGRSGSNSCSRKSVDDTRPV